MFDEALSRLEALGDSAAAILPSLLLGLVVCVWYIMDGLDMNLGTAWTAMQAKGYTQVFHTDPMQGNYFGVIL